MNPGPTFDRVYASLKEQLQSGRWAPGEHLEPAAIGEDLGASITPVRDALHRLVGERLVVAPRHDGFWVSSPTETELRALYTWSGDLAGWALRRPLGPPQADMAVRERPVGVGELFLALARGSGNPELAQAMASSVDRLAEYRTAEGEVLDGMADEFDSIAEAFGERATVPLRREVRRYHKRRERAAPLILAARRRPRDAGHIS